MTDEYRPLPTPQDYKQIPEYLQKELARLADVISALRLGYIPKVYAAPDKPRTGMIRYADGTTWNPGSGEGIYFYNGSVWTKL